MERSAPVDGVTFTRHLPESAYVHARTNEIQQVFVNLIKNAAEAVIDRFGGAAGGEVVIKAGQLEDAVWAEVSDNGSGIPEDKQSVIFDPFYTTKPPGKGTGLGLNVVYRILTKYRGTISVESQPDRGTTFRLKIPVEH